MQTPEVFRPDRALVLIAHQLDPRPAGDRRSGPPSDTGLLSALRRFHPATHGRHCALETERVLHRAGVHSGSTEEHLRWAVVVHCLALVRGAVGTRGPGQALAQIGYGESRLRQLLQADAALLLHLMPTLARRLHAKGAAVDWWPLAKLLLHAGRNEPAADEARAWIANDFVGANAAKTAEATDTTTTTGSPP